MLTFENLKICTLVALLVSCASSYIRASPAQIEIAAPYVALEEMPSPQQAPQPTNLQRQIPLLAAQPFLDNEPTTNTELRLLDYRFRRKKHILTIVASTGISTLTGTVAIMSATSTPTDDFNGATALLWTIIPGCVALGTAIYSGYHSIKLCKLCCQRRGNT